MERLPSQNGSKNLKKTAKASHWVSREPSIRARFTGLAHSPGRIVCRPAVVRALIVISVFGAMSFNDGVSAFIDGSLQGMAIGCRAVLANLPIHFGGSSHADASVANLVLQQIREIARPLFLNFGHDIARRRPARHGGDNRGRRAQARAGTTIWNWSELIAPVHSPLGVTIEAIFPRTRSGNGLPNLAEAGAGDRIEVGRPMNRLCGGGHGQPEEESPEQRG